MIDWQEQQRALSFRLDEIVNGNGKLSDEDRAVVDLSSSIVLNRTTDQEVKSEWDDNTRPYWKELEL